MGSFAAQDKKALAGGTLPVPMTWIDGGGQLPYSHVVIDVSGSMIQSTFVPNVGPDKHNRMEYVYFLLRTMFYNGAITKNTKLYPMGDYHPHPTTRFVSAGMVLEPSEKGGAWGTFYHPDTPWTPGYDSEVGKVFYQIFEPKFGSSEMKWVNELPHTKTLLITDVGVQSLARSIGVSQQSFNHNSPLDIISW